MKDVDLYLKVRHAVRIEGLSERAAARRFGIDPRTVNKMMKFSMPPGYVRKKPPAKPKLDPFIPVIDRILGVDKSRPKKQLHTAKRIFERLRDEYGFTGAITIVQDYVAGWRRRAQGLFVPLVHPPGHAQADFGEAIGIIGGVERKIHFFAFDLPHSDACFVVAYPAERAEAFCDGHVQAFTFFGGVPKSILYDNTKVAVARILGDGKRQRTRVFSELQSHYLFEDRFGRPGKGNDKGKVEGLVGYARRNFLVPIPVFDSFAALNAHLVACCRRRMGDCLRAHDATIGERLQCDLAAFQTPLPAPYDACEKVPTSVSSLSLVRYRRNDYSVPTTFGHRDVLVRGYAEECERPNVAVAECFRRLRRIAHHKAGVRVRQVKSEEVDLALRATDDADRFPEVGLRMPRRMHQRYEHLLRSLPPAGHVILHDRDPTREAVLISQPLENPLRRMLLLLRP